MWQRGRMSSLTWHDRIALLDLGDGENRLNNESMVETGRLLDEVEAAAGVTCDGLVYGGTGRAFSLGFDLEAVGGDIDRIQEFGATFQQLCARLLVFPMPTIAMVNGHAIAAGAVLGIVADERVMRADRGWFSLPEVDLGAGFTPFLVELFRTKFSPGTISEATLTGRRYGGDDAVSAGLAASAHLEEDLQAAAVGLCRSRGPKTPENVRLIKQSLFRSVLQQPGLG